MEHIDIIIQKSTEDKLNRLAYQAVDDPQGFKKVMMLTILDDLIQWADELDDQSAVQFLKLKIEKLLTKYPECFIIPSEVRYNTGVYTNVNLPQQINTWDNSILNTDVLSTKNLVDFPIFDNKFLIQNAPKNLFD